MLGYTLAIDNCTSNKGVLTLHTLIEKYGMGKVERRIVLRRTISFYSLYVQT